MTTSHFLLFRFAGRTLALDASLVRQVVAVEDIFAIPGTTGALLGLIPAAGRALPLIDLAALGRLPVAQAELGLLCDIGGEQFALPAEQVIGFVNEEDAPQTTELLSESVLLGGYYGGGQKGQVLNPQTLLAALQERFISL